MKTLPFCLIALGIWANALNAQSYQPAFETTRLINAHTTETVKKRVLDIRITHRFGDALGDFGGIDEFFGFDNVTDVRIGFEYGVTNDLTLGFARSKGVPQGPEKLLDGYIKYKLLKQNEKTPLTLTLFASSALATVKKNPNAEPWDANNFSKFSRRLSYDYQIILARKFSDRLSVQLMPNVLHRNFVAHGDENTIFSMGAGLRFRISKFWGVIIDYYYPFSDFRKDLSALQHPLGIGLELRTGGHVFHLNFSNTPYVVENAYLPHTRKDWSKGEFRFGFNISRGVKL